MVEKDDPKTRPVLDPRVAYLVTSLMEDVMNHGNWRDGSRHWDLRRLPPGRPERRATVGLLDLLRILICVVWVGFDDNRDLGLSGTAAAAPIWAEFMKRAVALPAYRNVEPFAPPAGVTEVTVDPQSEQLATPTCPTTKQEVFIAGTEPTQYCFLHGGRAVSQAPPVSWLSHLFGKGGSSEPAPAGRSSGSEANGNGGPGEAAGKEGENPRDKDGEKKKGLLQQDFWYLWRQQEGSDKPPKAAASAESHP